MQCLVSSEYTAFLSSYPLKRRERYKRASQLYIKSCPNVVGTETCQF
ncbi:hypothetical protein PROFUN_04757 [Planoprotostelium fungivorum]|uniref:Uncharacterized protein n=1 Tax=Planoprotostelium fungivorum TaxID=1890364 RepID=A0A2P6NG18_9EUKA|nr:hypothetical protein PROFUN_04757 [Planoprotostelium fungivorum]